MKRMKNLPALSLWPLTMVGVGTGNAKLSLSMFQSNGCAVILARDVQVLILLYCDAVNFDFMFDILHLGVVEEAAVIGIEEIPLFWNPVAIVCQERFILYCSMPALL